MPSRNVIVTLTFGAVFGIVAILAAATAAGTTAPWFSASISSQMYGISLAAAIIVAVALATVAVGHMARLEEARRSINLRIAAIPEADQLRLGEGPIVTAEAIKMIPPSDEEVDELLTTLATPLPGAPPGSEIEVAGTLVEVSSALTAARTRKELLRALILERSRVDTACSRLRPTLTGPILVCLLFAFAAGAMLPGSEGFAATNYQLNTGLILFLGYGWAFLGAWAVAAFALLIGGGQRRPTDDNQPAVR